MKYTDGKKIKIDVWAYDTCVYVHRTLYIYKAADLCRVQGIKRTARKLKNGVKAYDTCTARCIYKAADLYRVQ